MEEKQYHIALTKEMTEGARYVIMPGDPGRVKNIASYFENSRKLTVNREYESYLGYIHGVPVLSVSHGIGGPSTSIAIEELHHIGVDTMIRIGTCGSMQMDVRSGDVIVVNGAIRMEGTTKEYMPIEFPAVANFEVLTELAKAAEDVKARYHVGIVECKDSFYGQHSPESMPVGYELLNKWQAWIRGGTLASEMESSTLFTVASVRGIRAGAVMHCVWNQERKAAGIDDEENHDTDLAVRVAVRAMERLIEKDMACKQ